MTSKRLPARFADRRIPGDRAEAARRWNAAPADLRHLADERDAELHARALGRPRPHAAGAPLSSRDLLRLADGGAYPEAGEHLRLALRRTASGAGTPRPIVHAKDWTDEAGNARVTQNGDILGRLLSESPIYRREAPDVEIRTASNGLTYITGVAAKEVAQARADSLPELHDVIANPIERVFCDSETALRHAPELLGLRPSEPGSADHAWSASEVSAGAWLDRRYSPDPIIIETARRMLDVLDREIDLATLRPVPEPSPVGGSPRVGAYLAGSPNSMWRTGSTFDEQGPVRIFFDQSSIGGGKAEDIAARGAALLALTLAVQQIRPVELWATTQGTASTVNATSWGRYRSPITGEIRKGTAGQANTIFAMRVGAAPVDVEAAAVALGDRYTGVGFCYRMENLMAGHRVGASAGLGVNGLPFEVACGADAERDIVVGPIHVGDYTGGVLPWLKRTLGDWLGQQGADASTVEAVTGAEAL